MSYLSEELLKRCYRREEPALHELYRQCYPLMRGICMRYVYDDREVGTVVNDSFVKMVKALDQYDSSKDWQPWVSTITIRVALDYVRKVMREKQKMHLVTDCETIPTHHHLITYNAADLELDANQLRGMLQELPDRSRVVFTMFAIEGYSHKEICEQLDITSGTSKWHVSNARKLLQEEIRKHQQAKKKVL